MVRAMNSSLPVELLGAWRLVSYEDRDTEEDECEQQLPAGSEGVAICDRAGTWSVHVYAPPPADSDDPDEEALYLGDFGRCEVRDGVHEQDTVRGTLVVEMLGGHPVSVFGGNDPRPFEITGDTLVLGDQKPWRRTGHRIT